MEETSGTQVGAWESDVRTGMGAGSEGKKLSAKDSGTMFQHRQKSCPASQGASGYSQHSRQLSQKTHHLQSIIALEHNCFCPAVPAITFGWI